MTEHFQTALAVMAVGLVTVFLVLGLVVLTGRMLILLTNRYLPEPAAPGPAAASAPTVSAADGVPAATVAVIVAAVEVATGGRGRVEGVSPVE